VDVSDFNGGTDPASARLPKAAYLTKVVNPASMEAAAVMQFANLLLKQPDP